MSSLMSSIQVFEILMNITTAVVASYYTLRSPIIVGSSNSGDDDISEPLF
jgi:hypothetical protein